MIPIDYTRIIQHLHTHRNLTWFVWVDGATASRRANYGQKRLGMV